MKCWRLVVILTVIIIALLVTRCASRQLTRDVVEQQVANTEAVQIAEQYIPTGPHRDKVVGALNASTELLATSDAARQKAETSAAKNQADATRWRWVKWGGGALLVALAGFGVFKIFRAV
ncbi:MAG: hypothetical protein JSR44_00495 [Spirochaetes bacterium]|nr:hypothetical protein [Spirochaetota bacterium]